MKNTFKKFTTDEHGCTRMLKSLFLFIRVYLCSSVVISSSLSAVEVKLKDISRIQGLRDNQITGYGIVTGLSGTGDTKSAVTNEAMKNYLKNQGLAGAGNAKGANITRNIASVLSPLPFLPTQDLGIRLM